MSLPTPTQPDRITAAELRAKFETLDKRLEQMENEVHQTIETLDRIAAALASALDAAASHPQQAPRDEVITLDVETFIMSYDDAGAPVYKVKGGQYQKFGIRVWPEVLPALGLNPATLKPGPNALTLKVLVLMGETGPRKVIGLAK
jgi:hypothetical protein